MSERKSINKYYPPDYDPSKQPKKKKQKTTVIPTVRLMLPFSIKCLHCDEYMAHRRKFNARKENTGEDYIGIKIIKFTFRCPKCYAQLSFQTDPKNGDFECIEGCKKNYEKPKTVKANESVDEMIQRLEKDAVEDAKLKEKGKKKNQITGVEELEKRMIQQQKEREVFDEIEMLQEESKNLETVKASLEEKLNIEELKYDEEEAIHAFEKKSSKINIEDSKEDEMLNSLINSKKFNTKATNSGLSLGYSSSSEEDEN